MSLREIFSGQNTKPPEYRRVIEALQTITDEETGAQETITSRITRIITPGTGKGAVTLVSMKSLSLEAFTYPFHNTTKIRDALKLQTMPYTAGGGLEIFPVILSKSGREASGIVWYVSPNELDIPDTSANVKIWPAPLPFVSQLEDYGGNGVTMWADEVSASSILWQDYKPLLYRWRKLTSEETPAHELSWYDAYCAERELERGGNFIMDASVSGEDFIDIVSDSLKLCPWISDVNLSRTVLEGARDLERTVSVLTRVSIWLLIAGAIALGAEVLSWYHLDSEIADTRSRSEKFYRETFDPERTGRISNPVNLARDKIASLTGRGEEGHPLDDVLADLGEVITSNKDITVDIMRYSQEGIDLTGTAPEMTAVLNFRRSWEERANLVQVDNTQFVSGIGYRFDLRVRW